uniref:Fur family transcriptional regulator n=1 Tax=Prevotella sp. TaxID=59823 RepID=UPI004029902D
MKSQDIISKLEGKGIKPTANRILVMKALAEAETPQSLSRLERKMVSMDKSSIFRVLTLFLEHDVVHAFEDGKGILNYELCEEEGKCDHHDGHIHFYCESCERSFCMEDIHIPSIQLPEGFFPHSVSFVIKGECPECRSKHQHHIQ